MIGGFLKPPHDTRILVISTTVDLYPYRQAATKAIELMGLPVVQETDGAAPSDALKVSLRQVSQADLVIVVVAWRYGYIPEGEVLSLTHLEYREARRLGKPILVFLADPATQSDYVLFPESSRNLERQEHLYAFRNILQQTHLTGFFTTPDDLAVKILVSLHRLQQSPELAGASDSGKVFLSYRRSDMPHAVGRIFDWLSWYFGVDAIFMDVQNIPFGEDFREFVQSIIAQCAVQIVVIGPQWIDMADNVGHRRLDDSNDMVRVEIETALEHNIGVIPAYLDSTPAPRVESLPENLQPLCKSNGIMVRDGADFRRDMQRLISAVERYVRQQADTKGSEH